MILGKGTSLYMQLGKTASTMKSQVGLKYCPTCLIEDRKGSGEAYWHRSHQADGVFVCHIHATTLISSKIAHNMQKISISLCLWNKQLI